MEVSPKSTKQNYMMKMSWKAILKKINSAKASFIINIIHLFMSLQFNVLYSIAYMSVRRIYFNPTFSFCFSYIFSKIYVTSKNIIVIYVVCYLIFFFFFLMKLNFLSVTVSDQRIQLEPS